MPIVTNGLVGYWNPKQGLSAGAMANLAPGGAAWNLARTGTTVNAADGAIFLDGIDDYLTLPLTSFVTSVGNSWTYEFYYTGVTEPEFHEFMSLGGVNYIYHDANYADIYQEFYISTGYSADTTVNPSTPAFLSSTKRHYVFRFDAATKKLTILFNGAVVTSPTFTQNVALFINPGPAHFFRGQNAAAPAVNFHAMRVYNRALTDTELATNATNGKEVGLGTPEVRIAIERISNGNGTFTDLPVMSITGHETEKLRVHTAEGLGYFPIVPTTDPNASRVRVRTEDGTFAIRKP